MDDQHSLPEPHDGAQPEMGTLEQAVKNAVAATAAAERAAHDVHETRKGLEQVLDAAKSRLEVLDQLVSQAEALRNDATSAFDEVKAGTSKAAAALADHHAGSERAFADAITKIQVKISELEAATGGARDSAEQSATQIAQASQAKLDELDRAVQRSSNSMQQPLRQMRPRNARLGLSNFSRKSKVRRTRSCRITASQQKLSRRRRGLREMLLRA